MKWEQTTIELHPTPGDDKAVGHFKYQNTGNKSVRFTSVRTSCGCTVAQTQKEEVAPGGNGEITATFSIGDRTGTQLKTVTVETDDPANANDPVLALVPAERRATLMATRIGGGLEWNIVLQGKDETVFFDC